MYTRPEAVADTAVAAVLRDGWGLEVEHVEYAAVGYGSYHWTVGGDGERWFVTVDDVASVERRARLEAALTTARRLHDSGLTFVVAPVLTSAGAVVHPVTSEFVAALYPYVEGESRGWGPYQTRGDRLAVIELLVHVHRAVASARGVALVDDFAIPERCGLVSALTDLTGPWDAGPFGEPARRLLARHVTEVERVLARYDALACAAAGRRERVVLTHGEPHRGDTIVTGDGVVLIDWDTCLLAPPERDVWSLAAEDPGIVDEYTVRSGVLLLPEAIEQYQLAWDLTEISYFVGLFRRPHLDTADTKVAWEGLTHSLDPTHWT